jgi:hypothetical protein
MSLTDPEKRFIQRIGRANAPIEFIAHHVWICRQLKLEPDFLELDQIRFEISDFILEAKS